MNPSQLLGKSTEMLIVAKLLAEHREVYLPCVDDHGVDIIVRTRNFDKTLPATNPRSHEFQEIQVKSVSEGGLFVKGKNIGKFTLNLVPTKSTPVKHPKYVVNDFSKLT